MTTESIEVICMTIGCKIKQYRKSKQLTQQQLADLINKSTVTIRKYEADDRTPSFKTLEVISKALDVDINCFFEQSSKINGLSSHPNTISSVDILKMEPHEIEVLDNIFNIYGYLPSQEDYKELKQLIEMFINSKKYIKNK